MSVGTTAGLVAAGIGAAGAVGGSLIQGSAAKSAAQTEAGAAQAGIDLQRQEFDQQQQNIAPWLKAGTGALGQLSQLTGPGGSLLQPYGKTFDPGQFNAPAPFQAPTGITEENDPGFQARLKLGQQVLEGSNAAKGITGGGALQAAEQYGQDYASNEFGNVYNRALNTYNTNYNSAMQAYQTNYNSGLGAFNTNYNVFQNDQSNQFNRLASVAGIGQTATGQLNQAGQNYANQGSSLLAQQGNALAAGQIAGGNAYSGIFSGLTGAAGNYANYQQLQGIIANQNANNSSYGPYGTYTGGGSYNVPQQTGYDPGEPGVSY